MTYPANVTERIEGVRRHALAVLDELIARAREFGLADPPPALERYRQKLSENTYKVLVVGEAKRGKSTFVNALIGRDILPTDVDVATTEVSKGVKLLDVRAKRARRPCGAAKGRAWSRGGDRGELCGKEGLRNRAGLPKRQETGEKTNLGRDGF